MKLKVKVGKISLQEGKISALVGIVDDNGCYLSPSQVTNEYHWNKIKEGLQNLKCSYNLGTLLVFQINEDSPKEFLEIIREIKYIAQRLQISNQVLNWTLRGLERRTKGILRDLYYEKS